ncbi:ABC transporter substrate-binding protein [Sphaerisporangium rufum]|uniref:ABC transporter substrate-binding protein n=1 Tax=Sphaerisporangium rufum TaxID=1381558 RepID=A0A919QZR2_9ACTN|nr:iron-siderophore ABC transporter substrate-binding protein [Sphaerisporangium rufum]GII76982.1 ABC transporter substrate-binding protein [Sphaerisporangium rufum]
MRPLTAALAAALAALTALTGCGTTEPAAPAAATSAATPTDTATAAGPVTLTDGLGRQVKLDRPATRVVGLEWGEAEMLVTLGVMPVGVADVKGYGTWVTAARLDGSVKDVGTRAEPSVDSIAALQPDLVVMEGERDAALIKQLEKVAPVLVTKGSDAAGNLDRMRGDFNMIATAVGRTAVAGKVLADFDAALAAGRQKIDAAGAGGRTFAMADGWKQGSTISIRLFGKGALVSDVAERLGLSNAWKGKVDGDWGLGNTDVEGLTALKDKDVRFFYNASDGEDVFAGGLAGNAIWKSLPFVKAGQVTRLPDGIWTFGGPLSCLQYADAMVKAYAG